VAKDKVTAVEYNCYSYYYICNNKDKKVRDILKVISL